MKILKPIRETKSDYERLEAAILKLFKVEVYSPLLKSISHTTKVLNSMEDLIQSITEGHIRYETNGFAGVFSADVSKELKRLGAVWSKRGYKWLIRLENLPVDIQTTVAAATTKEAELLSTIDKVIVNIKPAELAEKLDFTKLFKKVTEHVETEFQKSVKGITVAPEMSKEDTDQISEEYSTNLKRYITDFSTEELLRLRKTVETHVFEGNRYESLIKIFQDSYGISQRKAKFLARQETSLLSSKIREVRYRDIGIDEYIWQAVVGTSKHPTRPMHKKLNGTVQNFSKPPITDPDGRRNNPGEDFNCRCVARPIVKF